MTFRRLIELSGIGEKWRTRDYWDRSLEGWASSYLGGTLSNDVRNAITLQLLRHLAPHASSLLDLGCAAGTLGLTLDKTYRAYWGVDISEVAINKAQVDFAASDSKRFDECVLLATQLHTLKLSRKFDVIVFNEVLYYLKLEDIERVMDSLRSGLAPGGIVVVSLKDHGQCRPIQEVLYRYLTPMNSILFQEMSGRSKWSVRYNAECPAYLVQAFKAKE